MRLQKNISNKASPLQAAGYSLKKIELSVFIEFLVFLSLFFDIITNRVLVTVFPDCPSKVAVSPELRSPKLFLDLGASLEDLTGSETFDHSHHLGDTIGGHGLDQEVDMVLISTNFQKLDLVALFDIQAYLFEHLVNGFVKEHFPVLGREYQVIDQYSDIMALVYVFACIHIPIVLRRKRRGIIPEVIK